MDAAWRSTLLLERSVSCCIGSCDYSQKHASVTFFFSRKKNRAAVRDGSWQVRRDVSRDVSR
jgi:hypothetical protein